MQSAKLQFKKTLFATDKPLCEPTTHRLIVELQAGVCQRNIYGKDHNHYMPSLAKRVEFVLNQPSIEEVHHWIMNDIQRIGDVAQEFAE